MTNNDNKILASLDNQFFALYALAIAVSPGSSISKHIIIKPLAIRYIANEQLVKDITCKCKQKLKSFYLYPR